VQRGLRVEGVAQRAHLAGSIFGTHGHVEPAEAIAWASYNLVVYAVVPFVYFRRGYSARQLNLVSSNRSGDVRVILVVLLLESALQYLTLSTAIGQLGATQYLVGVPVTFALYLAGAVLPAMVFIYCILVPRFLKLAGSTATTRARRQRLDARVGLSRARAAHAHRRPARGAHLPAAVSCYR
jgi:hypothetical protein